MNRFRGVHIHCYVFNVLTLLIRFYRKPVLMFKLYTLCLNADLNETVVQYTPPFKPYGSENIM